MKLFIFLLMLMNIGCSSSGNKNETEKTDSSFTPATETNNDTITGKPADTHKTIVEKNNKADEINSKPARVYSNKRFKDVTVERLDENKFRVKGKGQIFEASFSWVVEDGHNEIKQGYEMTDAGAPEWGNFNFVVEVAKKRPNSTLHIILYESSAKDGSRQHELLIKLY